MGTNTIILRELCDDRYSLNCLILCAGTVAVTVGNLTVFAIAAMMVFRIARRVMNVVMDIITCVLNVFVVIARICLVSIPTTIFFITIQLPVRLFLYIADMLGIYKVLRKVHRVLINMTDTSTHLGTLMCGLFAVLVGGYVCYITYATSFIIDFKMGEITSKLYESLLHLNNIIQIAILLYGIVTGALTRCYKWCCNVFDEVSLACANSARKLPKRRAI